MAPVLNALAAADGVVSRVCVSGQHAEMLAQVLEVFDIQPHRDLAIMRSGQTLTHVTTAVLDGLATVLKEEQPDILLVHGDTTTSMAAALAGFYAGVPVGHVEAGLRTRELSAPWPEEANRQITARLARWHFAPTSRARDALLAEAVPNDSVFVTGNTVIDALGHVTEHILPGREAELSALFPWRDPARRLILVTGHRRENFDGGLEAMCTALARLAARGDVQVCYPVHLNPVVRNAAETVLANSEHVHLIAPQPYLPFVWLMRDSYLVITDSGGIQEEAPSLGKPVLVTRSVTERPEAVEAGTVLLTGTDTDQIEAEATRLLDHPEAHLAMSRAHNPYGDGHAASRIVRILTGGTT